MADVAPKIIVLAFGAGALGFPDALRLLLDAAGRSPLADISICILAMGVATANVLATVLLARIVRNRDARARAGARGAAPAADLFFAQMTLVVSLAVAFPVFACLLAASGGGAVALGLRRLAADFALKSHVAEVVVAIAAAAALSCGRPLLRVFQAEDNARGAGAPAAAERFANVTRAVSIAGLFPGGAGLLVVACAVSGALWAQRSPLATVFVGVAAAVAAVLVGRFPCFAGNAGGGVVPAPAPAADTPRFGKLTQATFLAVVSFVVFVLATTYVPLERHSDGAKYPWSA